MLCNEITLVLQIHITKQWDATVVILFSILCTNVRYLIKHRVGINHKLNVPQNAKWGTLRGTARLPSQASQRRAPGISVNLQ